MTVSAMITTGCLHWQEILKPSIIMGAESEANPSIEGAVANIASGFPARYAP